MDEEGERKERRGGGGGGGGGGGRRMHGENVIQDQTLQLGQAMGTVKNGFIDTR